MVLENFYNEYRFPPAEMKAQMAVQIGLKEKQISSWFYHRRLKDERTDEPYATSRDYKLSGYLKVRGKIQNPAITIVKMQLGRYYHGDGLVLVAFDPLLVHLSSQAVIWSMLGKRLSSILLTESSNTARNKGLAEIILDLMYLLPSDVPGPVHGFDLSEVLGLVHGSDLNKVLRSKQSSRARFGQDIMKSKLSGHSKLA